MRIILLTLGTVTLVGCLAQASPTPNKDNQEEVNALTVTIGFSSAQTDFKRDCQLAASSGQHSGDLLCKGRGGYNIYVNAFPGGVHLSVLNGGPEDILFSLPDQGTDYLQRPVRWRMANGQTFAVIYRVYVYDTDAEGSSLSFDKKHKIGEKVIVRGLKGWDDIDGQVDGKSAHNEQKAEQLADNAYLSLQGQKPK